jgi:Family of unknown function (DUF6278)
MGPKHGVARGVAVFTSKESIGPNEVMGALGGDGRLREWCLAHGVVLDDDAQSLDLLDAHLDEWHADPSHYERIDLGNGVGIYLGNLILNNVEGSRWRVWPNGHPVIALASGRELDVTALVGDRLLHSGPNLSSIYARAVSE